MLNSKKLVLAAFLLIVSFILMLFSYYDPTRIIQIRKKGYFLGSFFYNVSSDSKLYLSDLIKSISEAQKIKKENELLRRRLDELIFKERSYYREIQIANQRLERLLNFKEKTPYRLIPTRVVAYSLESFFKEIYINKGKKDGIKEGMSVVNADGLVGKVVEVYSNQSKVMLIIDNRSKVGVRVQRTRDVGILQGTGNPNECRLLYILTKSKLEKGDSVITSGLGGLFPPGIPAGYISHIEKNPSYLFQKIKVKPAVDFGKLEDLFLIEGKE